MIMQSERLKERAVNEVYNDELEEAIEAWPEVLSPADFKSSYAYFNCSHYVLFTPYLRSDA
jgi:hypothetical protein